MKSPGRKQACLPAFTLLIGLLSLSACSEPSVVDAPDSGRTDADTGRTDSGTGHTDPAVLGVTINEADLGLHIGGKATLTVTVAVEDGASDAVYWASSNVDIAVVSSTGEVTALGLGSAEIKATSTTDESKSDKITVSVTPKPAVLSVSIDQQAQKVALDGNVAFTATVDVEVGASKSVTWKSSNEAVATIADDGTVELLAAGSTTISATSTVDAGKTDSVALTVYDPAVALWTHQFGTPEADFALAAATDLAGNVIVVGETQGTLGDYANQGSYDAFVRKLSPTGEVVWTVTFGSTGWDKASGVAIDADQNVIVVGNVEGSLVSGQPGIGGYDIFVVKLNANGNHLWTREFGTTTTDSAVGVAVDSENNVIVAGNTAGNFNRPREGSQDAIVFKLKANGDELWRQQFGTTGQDYAQAVSVDSLDNIVVAGFTAGTFTDSVEGESHGSSDAFARKFTPSGTHSWTRQLGTDEYDKAVGVGIDSEDNIIVVGSTNGALPGATVKGDGDAFAYKLSPDGADRWTRQFGTSRGDEASGVTIDSEDNPIVGGNTYGSFASPSTGNYDAFTHKLDADGGLIRTVQFGADDDVPLKAVTNDRDDNVIVVGYTRAAFKGASAGKNDAFVRKYAP